MIILIIKDHDDKPLDCGVAYFQTNHIFWGNLWIYANL